jgi:hypothetical protein
VITVDDRKEEKLTPRPIKPRLIAHAVREPPARPADREREDEVEGCQVGGISSVIELITSKVRRE